MPQKPRKLLEQFVHSSGLFREKPLFLRREHLVNGFLPAWELVAREHAGRYGTKASAVQGYGKILGLLDLSPKARVVSVGSGNGFFETFLAKHVCPEGEVIGIDFSRGMNSIARSFAHRERVGNISFLEAKAEQLPLASHSQDLVLSVDMLHFSPDWKKTVAEFARLVAKKPEAKVVVMFKLEASSQRLSADAVQAELANSGLEIVSSMQLKFSDKLDKEQALALAKQGFFGHQLVNVPQRFVPRFIVTTEALIVAKPKL